MTPTRAYAVHAPEDRFAPFSLERRDPRPNDVVIAIRWCGVCHSDLHTARGEWSGTRYPCVPGHEIVGEVTAVGDAVTAFQVGDTAAVGCLVDSCKTCSACGEGLEQYCENGFTGTYNGPEQDGGGNTFGGYSDRIVVREDFVLKIRHDAGQLAAVAPLLCAGITTWSPLKHWSAGPGKAVGIVGIGGLGHMGVKLAKALGAHVVAFTTSPSKVEDARALGADEVVVSTDRGAMKAQAETLDLIIDTVAVPHNLDSYLSALKRDGTMVMVGAAPEPHPSPSVGLLMFRRRHFAGSLIGGIAETQEMLDFCAQNGIVSDIETIAMQDIETAYARMLKSDVKYRFVIDMATIDG
ncbi:MAG TPA: NAD(P)-dependent alcohol dehydrogenase [Allosphingosinicella sp.]|nr:NAD(P)-dependent alcohol dehydrogenase [Allosphingosinicella sp.]